MESICVSHKTEFNTESETFNRIGRSDNATSSSSNMAVFRAVEHIFHLSLRMRRTHTAG